VDGEDALALAFAGGDGEDGGSETGWVVSSKVNLVRRGKSGAYSIAWLAATRVSVTAYFDTGRPNSPSWKLLDAMAALNVLPPESPPAKNPAPEVVVF
jgi:hypothetical protein